MNAERHWLTHEFRSRVWPFRNRCCHCHTPWSTGMNRRLCPSRYPKDTP